MTPAYRHSATTRAVLRALVPVICPPEAAPLADAIVDHVERALAAAPVAIQRGLAAGLAAYDAGALVRHGRRARALTGEAAERYFASWERGPTPLQQQLAGGVNRLVSMACYEQPEMMARVGYQPAPWIAEVTARRLATYRDEIARQEAQLLAPDPLRPGVDVARLRARPT